MRPEQFAAAIHSAARPSKRSHWPALLGIAAISMAATSAVLSWQERDFRDASTAAARLACESQDAVMRENGVTVLLRDARASIEVLKRVRDEGGVGSTDAGNAIRDLQSALR